MSSKAISIKARFLTALLSTAAIASAITFLAMRPEASAGDNKNLFKQFAAIAAYAKAAIPNQHHLELCRMAGTWNFEVTTYLGPAPETAQGVATFESILGGRYVVQETKSKLLGKDFDGFCVNGFDNVSQEYFMVWVDSWSTGIYVLCGKAPARGEPLELRGDAKDAYSPNGRPWRMVRTWLGPDEFRLEVYDTLNEGDPPAAQKVTELHYRRAK